MAHYRAPQQRQRRFPWTPVLGAATAVAVVCIGGWYWASRPTAELVGEPTPRTEQLGLLTASEPHLPPVTPEPTDAGGEKDVDDAADGAADETLEPQPSQDQTPAVTKDANESAGSKHPALEAVRRQFEAGKLIEARHAANALLKTKLDARAQAQARRLLTRIADESLFSKRRLPDDPLVEHYVVQPGDVLIHIGKKYDVPAGILMRINGIADARRIQAGQALKVPRGPFHLKIYKSQFRMDVYLQELYLRSYPVGLGVDASTPEGLWLVKNRLSNPTYYPPPSAAEKRIIPADDPSNPLGEHWIGLEYVEGDAVDTEKYGIHGTIAPASIGKNASAGCVRMHNNDVAFVYSLLQPGRSTVTILP